MPQKGVLDAIGLRHGTDKASSEHNYLSFYEMFFSDLKEEDISLLEIGVLGGASLRTWRDYFTKAKIVGADISPLVKFHESDRIEIELLDQSNVEELTRTGIKHGPFDIIIEDGSHFWEHQVTCLRTLFPFVKDGGMYIVEDLQTNYGSLQDNYRGVASVSCVEYLKSLVDLRVAGNQVDMSQVEDAFLRTYGQNIQFITFYRHACLIKKQFPVISREVTAGTPLAANTAGGRLVRVRINGHLSFKGDVLGGAGYINFGEDDFLVQGFSIATDKQILEYRALQQGTSIWSEWRDDGDFVGTRGESKPLVGFSVRLKKGLTDHYRLRVLGRFAGSSEAVEAADAQNCAVSPQVPLCGIQVEVTERG